MTNTPQLVAVLRKHSSERVEIARGFAIVASLEGVSLRNRVRAAWKLTQVLRVAFALKRLANRLEAESRSLG